EERAALARLAERYRDHPALLLWHVSNEYNGDPCFCPHCLAAWRDWLRARYDNDLDRLNRAWWTGFWAHTFSDWDEILPVDHSIHGMMLDWKRFNSEQTVDFFRVESAPLRSITPAVPITTNFMGFFESLDYFAFAEALDVASWDSYPRWHDTGDDVAIAREAALAHDLVRGLKNGQPFLLMESVPSTPTRQDVRMRKRPGMHLLSSLQAVAHGSDSVQYFQWRKGRGGIEKFHGAVVDHVGHEHTRVFREVADVGAALGKLDAIVGTEVPAEVALVYDWENRWAVHNAIGLGEHVHYIPTCQAHYRPFWERGVPVDVVDQTRSLDGYKLVVAPMLYLLRPGMAERLRAFVEGGGTLVGTYWTGIVDQHDLCHLGGWPGAGLRKLFGVWDEELDVLAAGRQNTVRLLADNALGLEGAFTARELCTLIHAEGAEVLAEYGDDFYAGRPALTAHRVGDGTAYYVASRNEHAFQATFADRLVDLLGIATPLPAVPPPGASVQVRRDAENEYLFLMNFTTEPVTLALGPAACTDLLEGGEVAGEATLAPYGVRVLQRART
ncbi:MAG: beta-galactosidase, partial [Planctomycetota bacterium]